MLDRRGFSSVGSGGTCVSRVSGLQVGSRALAALKLRKSVTRARAQRPLVRPASLPQVAPASSFSLLDSILDSQRLLTVNSDELVINPNGLRMPEPQHTRSQSKHCIDHTNNFFFRISHSEGITAFRAQW